MRLTPSHGSQEVHGPFLPVTSALHFKALDVSCLGDMGARGACGYYLKISPSGTDRELHALQGTGGGAEAEPGMTDAQVLKVLADKVAKLREKYPDVPPRRRPLHPNATRH